jgi:hypothetical protein
MVSIVTIFKIFLFLAVVNVCHLATSMSNLPQVIVYIVMIVHSVSVYPF